MDGDCEVYRGVTGRKEKSRSKLGWNRLDRQGWKVATADAKDDKKPQKKAAALPAFRWRSAPGWSTPTEERSLLYEKPKCSDVG